MSVAPLNRTERMHWLEEMRQNGLYQKIIRRLDDGENETTALNEIHGLLAYLWQGSIVWHRTWVDYPKLGNPVIHFECVTNEVQNQHALRGLLPDNSSYWDDGFPLSFWTNAGYKLVPQESYEGE